MHEERVRQEDGGQDPRVVLRVEREAVQDPGGERPEEPALERAPVDVDAPRPHRHDGDVEAREVRVEEDARHEREEDGGDDPRTTTVYAGAEEVGHPEADPGHGHAGEAEGKARVGEQLPLLVEGHPREREEALHERRVLVVGRPARVDGALLHRAVQIRAEELEPARVVARGVEVEALVAREAERTGRGEEPDDVRETEQRAHRVIAGAHRGWQAKDLPEAAHRVSASKQ